MPEPWKAGIFLRVDSRLKRLVVSGKISAVIKGNERVSLYKAGTYLWKRKMFIYFLVKYLLFIFKVDILSKVVGNRL